MALTFAAVPSSGEKNLRELLKSMQPQLLEGTYGFVHVPPGRAVPPGLKPFATCEEPEGPTLILTEADLAKSGLPHAFFCRCIALSTHSSLYAVGFLAAVSERLAKAHMSINLISGFHRDYVFVPTGRAEEAVSVLKKLAAEQ